MKPCVYPQNCKTGEGLDACRWESMSVDLGFLCKSNTQELEYGFLGNELIIVRIKRIYKNNQSRGHRTLTENSLTLYFMTCKLILLDCSVSSCGGEVLTPLMPSASFPLQSHKSLWGKRQGTLCVLFLFQLHKTLLKQPS